jgi:glutathione S-transferase
MARRPPPALEIEPKIFTTTDEIDRAINKLQRRIKELEQIDFQVAVHGHTGADKIAENNLQNTILEISHTVAQGRSLLDTTYRWLDQRMTGREWAAGETFSLADCAAAPSLFYADWAHPIVEEFRELRAYRNRLLGRPSFARAVDEARPYRRFFPLRAPDRD